nr:hypothetical protein [Tanacetum cinerariifolium]
ADAHAGVNMHALAFDHQRQLEALVQFVQQRDDLLRVLHVLEEDHELVAAEPRDVAVRLADRTEQLGHRDQYLVAEAVAMLIVHLLEVI